MEEFILKNYYILGSKKISEIFNCGRGKVLKIAKMLNLDTSMSTVKKRLKSKSQNDSFERYKNILNFNTPKNSYLLGFLWADGHLREDRLTCSISIKDYSQMRDVFLDFNFKETFYTQKVKGKSYDMVKFDIYNKDIMTELSKLEFKNKSFISPIYIYNLLDANNFKYFISGFFDGDGNVSKSMARRIVSFSFDSRCNTDLFEDYFQKLFSKIFVRKQSGNSKVIVISRKNDLLRFYNTFIKDCEFSMKRKKDILEKAVSFKGNKSKVGIEL